MDFPSFDENLPILDQFILELVSKYRSRALSTWDELEDRCRVFYTPAVMDTIESKAMGWKKMASYSDGITLTHVTCVFLGMFMLPEFRSFSSEQQQLAKWIVLFHDIDKIHIGGKRDAMHAFRSGVVAANILPKIGFPVTDEYEALIHSWSEFTFNAFTEEGYPGSKPDNRKLPDILKGIEQLFGENTPACLIVKTALLHISLNIDINYPTPSPLTDDETKQFISPNVFPLLKVMMLSDTEGWSLFEPELRHQRKRDAFEALKRIEELVLQSMHEGTSAKMNHKETVRSGYNLLADRYLAERDRDADNVRLLVDFIELLAPRSRVLDAGCGAGIPITQMLAEHFEVLGVDFSEEQIERAKRNVPNATFFCQDMTSLNLPGESLDGICSYYAIIHIPREEHNPLFVNFHRMLRTGGVALLCLGAEDLHDDIDDFLGTPMYWSHYSTDTYLKMLRECGFTVIWAKLIEDETCAGAKHLFVLAQKESA